MMFIAIALGVCLQYVFSVLTHKPQHHTQMAKCQKAHGLFHVCFFIFNSLHLLRIRFSVLYLVSVGLHQYANDRHTVTLCIYQQANM